MKYLQHLFILLTVSAFIFSCQKEYSAENYNSNASTSAQWSFAEGSSQFKGPIDTVTVDTVGTYTFLTINGHSTDNKDQITLQMFGSAIKVGTYKTPFSLFAYLRNGVVLYQTNQTLVDSFTISITKYDSTGITGTFNGKAFDSAKNSKTIVDGQFSSVFKTTAPVTAVDSGQVVIWSTAGCGGGTSTSPISVSVGTKSGTITKFSSIQPTTCDPAGSFYLTLPVGTYPVVIKCGSDSVSTTVTILKNVCTKLEVSPMGSTTALDYFPTTANSNWSYLYENSTPDDTLYTLSTGQTGTINGSLPYNLFTDADGSSKDSSLYRKAIPNYYAYFPAEQDTSNGGTNIPAFEYKFLIDNVAANTTFPSAGPISAKIDGLSGTLSVSTLVIDTGATATISGIPYTSIIKVKTTYSFTYAGSSESFYAMEQWFAKGVGLVKYLDYSTAPFTTPDDVLDLTRSKVY